MFKKRIPHPSEIRLKGYRFESNRPLLESIVPFKDFNLKGVTDSVKGVNGYIR